MVFNILQHSLDYGGYQKDKEGDNGEVEDYFIPATTSGSG